MIAVLDVSAAIEILLQKKKKEIFNDLYKKASWVIAPDMIDDYFNAKELWKEALSEGIKNNHPVYDMYYSVLARRHDAVLITNDSSLVTICNELKIAVCY